MEILLWVLGLYAGYRVLIFVVSLHAVSRLRLIRHRFRRCEPHEVPEPMLALFERAAEPLIARGFEPIGFARVSPALENDDRDTPALCLHHTERATWALLLPATNPYPAAPLDLVLSTHFPDRSVLSSVSGRKLELVLESETEQTLDTYRLRFEEQLDDHWSALAAREQQPLTLDCDAYLAAMNRRIDEEFASQAEPMQGERWHRVGWRRAFRFAWNFARGAGTYQKLQQARLKASAGLSPNPEAQRWLFERALHVFECTRAQPPRRAFVWGTFLATGAAFAIAAVFGASLEFVLQLMLVLLVHELGHFLAMRLTGYHQASIFFVPLLGAATIGRKTRSSFWGELFVLAAGPIPGLIAASALLMSDLTLPPFVRELATQALWLNGVNLLPFWPLDGGKIVQLFFVKERPLAEAAFPALSAVVFAAVAVFAQDAVMGVLALSTVMGVKTTYQAARQSRSAREVAGGSDPRERAVAVTANLPALFAQRALLALRIMERLRHEPSPVWQRGGAALGYVAALVLSFFALGLTGSGTDSEERVLACDQLTPDTELPADEDFTVLGCRPAPSQDLSVLRQELDALSELPATLAIRDPWQGKAGGLSERELRARDLVRTLERAWRRGHASETDDEPAAQVKARAMGLLQGVLDEARDQPDFDAQVADAYLAFRREETVESVRRLEAQLGSAASAGQRLNVLYAHASEDGTLSVGVRGSVDTVVRQLCARGCRSAVIFAQR